MPDLTFYPDPNVDRVLGVIMELAAEVHVLRDRLSTLEALLERNGTLSRADLKAYVPSDAERSRLSAERDAMIARILAPMTATFDSPAPPYEAA